MSALPHSSADACTSSPDDDGALAPMSTHEVARICYAHGLTDGKRQAGHIEYARGWRYGVLDGMLAGALLTALAMAAGAELWRML